MHMWWKRNAPVLLGLILAAPFTITTFWPAYIWSIATVVVTLLIMLSIDAYIHRDPN